MKDILVIGGTIIAFYILREINDIAAGVFLGIMVAIGIIYFIISWNNNN